MSPDRSSFEMLSRDKACLVMIDHQAGLMLYPRDIDPLHLKNNAVALAKVAKANDLPVVLSAAAQGPLGPIGPIIPEILELFPDAPIIYRTKINSWHDQNFRSAVEATGRKQIIIAGIDASFCAGLPAKSMVADGYDVHHVVEASGNTTELTLQTTIANLTQAGVKCANWVEVACQLLADWADEEHANRLLAVYKEHLPGWSMLGLIQDGAKDPRAYRGPQQH